MARERKNYWELDGDSRKFNSLKTIEETCYDEYDIEDRKQWLDHCEVYHIENGVLVDHYIIYVKEDGELEFTKYERH